MLDIINAVKNLPYCSRISMEVISMNDAWNLREVITKQVHEPAQFWAQMKDSVE